MARSVMDNGALPMLYYSPAPYAVPAPCYVIPQPIPQYSAAPQYVYNSISASEHGAPQSNGEPIFKVVPPQSHQHQYPIHNIVPVDANKKEVTLQEALENALTQQKQPKAQMVQQIPPGCVARHPLCVMSEGTMLGQPVHYDHGSHPVYGRLEDVGDANRSHLPFGNQQPNCVQYVNGHGMPITAHLTPAGAGSESQPLGLPAAQPGMRWKLVPVADSDREEARGAVPVASPKPSSAPMMRLKSPEAASDFETNSVVSTDQSDDPYKRFLSLLLPKVGEKLQAKDKEDSKTVSKVAPANPTADSIVPEMEMKPAGPPKSVRIIPVTDAPTHEKGVVLEGKGFLKESDASRSDAKAGPLFVKKPSTLKPIRLVPSLDFVKEKEVKHASGSKQFNPQNLNKEKAVSHQTSAKEGGREKEVPAEMNIEKALAALNTSDEATPKTENVAPRPRAKSMEGLRDVKSHMVQQQTRLVADSEVAARRIQSVYRGYVVRRCQPLKHLRDIARVKSLLKEYQALAADRSSLLEKCQDPAERTKISEGIMSLLLRLDVIQGVDPVVRDIRKYASKEVLKLQSEVDAAMALIFVSPQVVSKELEFQATPLGMLDDETKSVDGKVAKSVELSTAAETNESVEHPHDHIATNGLATQGSKSEEGMACENQPQVEEEVADLLRKLLNKLPKFRIDERREVGDACEFSDTDDSALISEVVKRLAFLKEQQRDKDTNTRRLNNLESSADSAHIEKPEQPTRSEMTPSEISSNELLPSRSGIMADDAASDSILEPATSGEEVLDVVPDVGGETFPISESMTSPTELELQNLADTMAADFDKMVLTHTEGTLASRQSKENSLKGQDILDSNNTTVSDDRIGLPPESASVDVSTGTTPEASKLVSASTSELEGMTPTEISGETQTETSLTNSDGEENHGLILKTSEVENDGERETAPSVMIRRGDDEDGPAHTDVNVRRIKVQIPNKSFASQEETLEVDSPTSVLDGVVSIALSEDVLSDDITMDAPEEMKMQQSTRESIEEQALQVLQSAISDLQSLNNEGEHFLNDESLQLESVISDLHSLNNSGQGFLDSLNPFEDQGDSVELMVRCPSVKRITDEVTYLPTPPSLSPEARHFLDGGVSPGDVCERLCPSSSETELTISQHLIKENAVLKKLVIDVLKWSQWQSSVTLQLHKMTENLALEVLETKTAAKMAVKCKQGRKKKAAKKKNKL